MNRTVTLPSTVAERGDVASIAELRELGFGPSAVDEAVASGSVVRLCRGWIASPHAPRHAAVSVIQRGKLTGPSLLASLGVWDGCDRRLHVLRPSNSHGIRTPTTPLVSFAVSPIGRDGLALHWGAEHAPEPGSPRWRTSIVDALAISARCLSREQFVACLDSALNRRVISRAALRALRAALTRESRRWLSDVDARAESGLETLTRERLRPLVDRIDLQVEIAHIGRRGGAGRVDLVIDGWLVIELDGDAYHDPVVDRDRTNLLIRMGYRVLRFGAKQVLEQWDDVEATVMEMLRYGR